MTQPRNDDGRPMERARAALLSDGRLHLQHGPIDIIAGAEGPGRDAAYARATARFGTVLSELVAELPLLRTRVCKGTEPQGPIGRAMWAAAAPMAADDISPMAAVAGAVAQEICARLVGAGITRAYANNGGDVAFALTPGETMTAAIAAPAPARVTILYGCPVRGVATSGWRGRSHSLGIADSVTVLASSAAQADAAATLIANAVDLPGHPGIRRVPARDLAPDSDLGTRLVTVDVPDLTPADVRTALESGLARARGYQARGLIHAAYLVLQGDTRALAPPDLSLTGPPGRPESET